MKTTKAVVHSERYNKTIKVNYDGYPEHLVPALTRIVRLGLTSTLFQYNEWNYLADNCLEPDGMIDWIPDVGEPIKGAKEVQMLTTTQNEQNKDRTYFLKTSKKIPHHVYVISQKGEVLYYQ